MKSLYLNTNLGNIFGFTALDTTITTVAPWLNLSSWGFYFWIFRASGQYFETLFNTITEFNLQYPNLQIPTAGLKGDLVELNIYGKKEQKKRKVFKKSAGKTSLTNICSKTCIYSSRPIKYIL